MACLAGRQTVEDLHNEAAQLLLDRGPMLDRQRDEHLHAEYVPSMDGIATITGRADTTPLEERSTVIEKEL